MLPKVCTSSQLRIATKLTLNYLWTLEQGTLKFLCAQGWRLEHSEVHRANQIAKQPQTDFEFLRILQIKGELIQQAIKISKDNVS